MKNAAQKAFIHAGRKREPLFADEEFALIPREYAHRVGQIDGACSMVFDIVDRKTMRVAGEIALRIGEGASLYYLGHIGYHMDPPYQGRHGALRACRMVLPLLKAMAARNARKSNLTKE